MSKRFSLLIAAAALLGFGQNVDAAGFALTEQSASGMGVAFAGGAAIAEDASTIFFNPAGLTRLCGNQVVFAAHGILPDTHFKDQGSVITPLVGEGSVQPINFANPFFLSGGNGGEAGEDALVGNSFYSHQMNDCLWLGLGITSQFGLSTKYDRNWVGRYHAIHSKLVTIDINPVFAYKFDHRWSIGGGFRAVYAHAKLTSAVDYGTIAWLGSLTLSNPAQTAVETGLNDTGFLPGTQNGLVSLKGNAWGWGGNLGVLYEPCCGTRFGFNWRSQVSLHIDGEEKFTHLPALIADPELAGPLAGFFATIAAAGAQDTGAKTRLTLPDLVQLSAYHEINPCWAVMADISWTRWSVLKKLVFKFDNANQPDNTLTLKWRNSFRYSIGTTYKPCCDWILRAGLAYDQTPIRSKELRLARLPDENRTWLATGVGYDWSSCLHFDVGYAYLFVNDAKVDKTSFEHPEDLSRGGLKGHWDTHVHLVSLQVTWKF